MEYFCIAQKFEKFAFSLRQKFNFSNPQSSCGMRGELIFSPAKCFWVSRRRCYHHCADRALKYGSHWCFSLYGLWKSFKGSTKGKQQNQYFNSCGGFFLSVLVFLGRVWHYWRDSEAPPAFLLFFLTCEFLRGETLIRPKWVLQPWNEWNHISHILASQQDPRPRALALLEGMWALTLLSMDFEP